MTDIDSKGLTQRLEYAQEIAIHAGQGLMKHFGRLAGFDTKSSAADLVTVADQEADDYLRTAVRERFPNDGLISEESDGSAAFVGGLAQTQKLEFTWCIDPLDGTTNFVHTYPNFAVSIGISHKGLVAGGVIHAPARKETFVGGLGIPAELNGKKISVSTREKAEQCLVATGFSKAADASLDRPLAVLRKILCNCHGMRRGGSAALDLCDLACGRIDAYYEWGLSPWDVMAGQAIVEAAGGRVSNTEGENHDPFGKSILATNGRVSMQLLGLLRANSVVDPSGHVRND